MIDPLFFTSFLAGLLTVLAPCVLPLLPIIVGSSSSSKSKIKPYIITLSLAISITIFSLLLKGSTILLGVDPFVWKAVSGFLVIGFGIIYIFPSLWGKLSLLLNLSSNSDKILEKASDKKGVVGDILVGASLSPVFASCSPTYSLILATVLPVSFARGVLYLLSYSFGLGVVMLAIALMGRKLVNKLGLLADPQSKFKKILGLLFVVVGVAVLTGLDKKFETFILDLGIIDPILDLESSLISK